MSGKHTPEPWCSYVAEFDGVECVAIAKDAKVSGETSAAICVIAPTKDMNDEDIQNARRIVACVNACKGWDTETLEEANAKGITLRETVDTLVMDILSGGRK